MEDHMKKQLLKVTDEHHEKRLDIFLSEVLGQTRSSVQKLIRHGAVLVNGKAPKKTGDQLSTGDTVEVGEVQASVNEEEYDVIHEDASLYEKIVVLEDTPDYVVISKPAGLLVHRSESDRETMSVADWILQKYPSVSKVGEYENRPGIMHRLDKLASGVLVIAKTQEMFVSLKNQFKGRTVEKEYHVLVHGSIEADYDKIDFSIDRGKEGRMVSRPRIDELSLKNVNKIQPGKDALTEFWVEQRFVNFSLLRVKLHTGRTHQIRVHMFAYNHPVVGDPLYMQKQYEKKERELKLGRIFLHAQKLCFVDGSGEKVEYSSSLPIELDSFLQSLK